MSTACENVNSPTSESTPQGLSSAEIRDLQTLNTADSLRDTFLETARKDQSIDRRLVVAAMAFAGLSFLLLHVCQMNFCDPDLWHEMSLFRQALNEGWIPTVDRFAYTPTVSPSIHHEWGAGAIFYAVMTATGPAGIMVLKYALMAGVVGCCYWCARMRGAGAAVFLLTAPAMAIFSSYGFTTIRAQVFTLQFLALMLCMLELDRRGNRWWIAVWLPVHVLWLNLHAGFVVGSGLMFLHACEQIARRKPFWHFVPVGMALACLVFVNPYGTDYLPYLAHGLTMARPLIVEWQPLWQHDPVILALFLASLVPVIYAGRQIGFRQLTGIVVFCATAYAAFKHTRHLSLYCVVWTCYVPEYLQRTRFGFAIERAFESHGRSIAKWATAAAVLCLIRAVPQAPWQLSIPDTVSQAEAGLVCYPVGAVQHLKETGFHGNLMLPFEVGGYAIWHLHPDVRVSIDGRYEVAYQAGVLEEHLNLFAAKDGWQKTLDRYPTDALLVPKFSRLSAQMPTNHEWTSTYDDGVYSVYVRNSTTKMNLESSSNDKAGSD